MIYSKPQRVNKVGVIVPHFWKYISVGVESLQFLRFISAENNINVSKVSYCKYKECNGESNTYESFIYFIQGSWFSNLYKIKVLYKKNISKII